MGRYGDLLRSDGPLSVGSVVASYSSYSPDLLAPFGAPPSYADVFDPSSALTQPVLSLTSTSTSTLPRVFYPDEFCLFPSLPAAAAVQPPAVPFQTLAPGLDCAINAGLNCQQAAVNPPLGDWDIDFNFESLTGSNDAILDWDQPARALDIQDDSPASDQSSPASDTTRARSTSHSAYRNTSSLASSNCNSSPAPEDPRNLGTRMGELFSCRQCGKQFGDRVKLQLHDRSHGERKYRCSVAGCDKRFKTKEVQKRHEKKIAHGGRKDFRCSRCPKAYGRKDNLQKHERMVHSVNLLQGARVHHPRPLE